jgi:hypothetical protein
VEYIVFFLLFFLQFVVFPVGTSFFESPKVLLSEILILVLILYAFVISSKKIHVHKTQLILFGILGILSLWHLLFQQTDTTFFGNQFRMQGVLLLWLLMGFSLITSHMSLPRIPLWGIGGILVLQLILSIIIDSGNGRAVGTLGEPNALSASVLFVWPFLLFPTSQNVIRKKKVAGRGRSRLIHQAVGIVVSILIILLSGSRSGLVAFVIQVLFLSLLFFKINFKTAAIVVILVTSCSSILPALENNPYENRIEIWKTALIGGYENWVFGFGFGNTEKILEMYGDKLYTGSHGYYVDSSHNFLLDFWVQGGFMGLSVIVLLLYLSLKSYIVRREKLLFTLCIGVVTVMLFNPVSVVTLLQFWWLIGQSFKRV